MSTRSSLACARALSEREGWTSLIAAGICVLGAILGLLVRRRAVRDAHADAFTADRQPSPDNPTLTRI
jgi:hypothetical protein